MEKMETSVPGKASGHGWLKKIQETPGLVRKFFFENKIFVGILLLASFLRLYKISDYMTFLGDEGRDVLVVKGILEGDLTLLGPRASAGDFFTGPIYYYFMAPWLWIFNYDPVGPAVMIALLGIVTVLLVYILGKRIFGLNAALVATFLYAISPVVIAYSRSSWNPNPMPFFSLVMIAVLYKAMKSLQLRFFLLAGFLLGIMVQLHYIELFFGAITFVFILLGNFFFHKSKLIVNSVRQLLVVFGGFLLGFSPFLAFEVRHNFPNLRTIVGFVFDQESTGDTVGRPFWVTIPDVFFRLFGRLITRFPPPEQVNTTENLDLFVWYWATVALGIASVFMLTKIKDPLWKLIFTLWFVVGVLMFGFYQKAIYDYYFEFLFPLPFFLVGFLLAKTKRPVVLISLVWYVLAAVILYVLRPSFIVPLDIILFSLPFVAVIVLSLDRLPEKKNFLGVFAASSVFVILVMLNLYGYPFQYEPNRQKDQVRLISEFVLEKAGGEPFNFALLTPGNSDHGYRYFFNVNNQNPVTLENVEIDPERNSVTKQLLVVCEDTSCQPLGNSLWEIAGFGRADIADSWDVSVVRVYKLKEYSGN